MLPAGVFALVLDGLMDHGNRSTTNKTKKTPTQKPGDAHGLYPTPQDADLNRTLLPFSLVSRDWHALCLQVLGQWVPDVARIDLNAPLSASLQLNPLARDVRLCADQSTNISNEELKAILEPRASMVVRLDLSGIPLDSPVLVSALDVAATACPLVRVLCLPWQREPTELTKACAINAAVAAIKEWHKVNGGLLHLRLPFGPLTPREADLVLAVLARVCPQIEFVDGWQLTYRVDDAGRAHCDAYWQAQPALWYSFWEACTQIRTFNTVMMPWSSDVLCASSSFAKPNVKSFEFATVSSFAPQNALNTARATETPDWQQWYDEQHKSVRLLLQRMTGLKKLRIEIPVVGGDAVWELHDHIQETLFASIYGRCPRFKELRIHCADPATPLTISGESMMGLSCMERLHTLEIHTIKSLGMNSLASLGMKRHQYENPLRARLSFVSGQQAVLVMLFKIATFTRTFTVPIAFRISLTRIPGDDAAARGLEDASLSRRQLEHAIQIIQNEHQDNCFIHVHVTPSRIDADGDSTDLVDLVHLELSLHLEEEDEEYPDCGPSEWREETFGYLRPRSRCGVDCVAPGLYVDDQ